MDSPAQYKGSYYLINWTLARTIMMLNCIMIYLLPHFLPLLWIQSKFAQIVNSHYSSFLVTFSTTIVWMFVLHVCSIYIVIFVGLLYLMLIDTVFVFTVLWIWTELPQKFLIRHIILQDDKDWKPQYHVDTTQKHYPRIRFPSHGPYHTGKPLFPKFDEWLDNHTDCAIDLPDVEEVPGSHCICSFVMKLHPPDPIHSFVVYFCDCREDDAFYEMCSAFEIPENVRVKIATNNSSMIIRCFDALHRVYHRDKELTLAMIKTKLSEHSDELQQIISDYHEN